MKHDAVAATRADLNLLRTEILSEIDDKIDQTFDRHFAMLRKEMSDWKDDLVGRYKLTEEAMRHDLLGANRDQFSLFKNTDDDHESRIRRLEKFNGLIAA